MVAESAGRAGPRPASCSHAALSLALDPPAWSRFLDALLPGRAGLHL